MTKDDIAIYFFRIIIFLISYTHFSNSSGLTTQTALCIEPPISLSLFNISVVLLAIRSIFYYLFTDPSATEASARLFII